MLNALAQIPQGTIADYRYAIQEPQHVDGAIWRVPVQVYFSVAVNVEGVLLFRRVRRLGRADN